MNKVASCEQTLSGFMAQILAPVSSCTGMATNLPKQGIYKPCSHARATSTSNEMTSLLCQGRLLLCGDVSVPRQIMAVWWLIYYARADYCYVVMYPCQGRSWLCGDWSTMPGQIVAMWWRMHARADHSCVVTEDLLCQGRLLLCGDISMPGQIIAVWWQKIYYARADYSYVMNYPKYQGRADYKYVVTCWACQCRL